MRLYLVRHAESQGNATGDYSTVLSDRLSSRGMQQAEALALRLAALRIDHVFVSPLTRAMQSIAPYLRHVSRCAEIWPELAEACWQEEKTEVPAAVWRHESCTLAEEFSALLRFRDNDGRRPVDDETCAEGLCRVHAVADRLLAPFLRQADCIVLLSHGFCIDRLMKRLLGTDVFFDHGNTAASLLSYDGAWRCEFTNRMREW